MTGYHTVFEISRTGSGMLEFFVVPLFFLALGVGLVRGWVQFQARRPSKLIGYFFIFFSLIMETLVIWNSTRVNADLEGALRKGHYQIVEGRVENLEPMNDWRNKHESFTVRGLRFRYSDFIVDQCFNHSSTHGGPIRDGLFVRVSYLDRCILRLEVADNQNRPN